jgi:hypothetical protein
VETGVWLGISVAVVIAYVVVMRWVLPHFGVQT